MAHLAELFGVSRRTIRQDILALTCFYPITTARGHKGGVRIAEGFYLHPNKTLSTEQETLLRRLRPFLYGQDLMILNSIIAQFGTSRE